MSSENMVSDGKAYTGCLGDGVTLRTARDVWLVDFRVMWFSSDLHFGVVFIFKEKKLPGMKVFELYIEFYTNYSL